MKEVSADSAFRRRRHVWQVTVGGRRREVRLRIGSREASVFLDGVQVCSSELPTIERRWLLLTVPDLLPALAVAVVRFPGRRYRGATFVDSVNVDDGSSLEDWGANAFTPIDRFEDNLLDSGVNRSQGALFFAVVYGYFYLSARPVTPARALLAAAFAACIAVWVLFCGRILVPYLAAQHSWPVSARNLTWAAVFAAGLFATILAAVGLQV